MHDAGINLIDLAVTATLSGLTACWAVIRWAAGRLTGRLDEHDGRIAQLEREFVSADQFGRTMDRVESKLETGLERVHKRLDGLYHVTRDD
jgi:hypothetical protein